MACVLLGYNVVSYPGRTKASSLITLPLINNNIFVFLFFIFVAVLAVNGWGTVYSKLNGKSSHHSDTLSHIPAKCNVVGTNVAAGVSCQM
jgi:hypothetical protein